MKKILLSAFFVGIATMAQAQQKVQLNIEEAKLGVEYGAGVSDSITYDVYDTQRIASVLDKTLENSLKNIVISATATAVCKKKGCWLTLQSKDERQFFVKMKDYAFFLPQNIVGKKILLHADVSKREISVKELRHYAEDAKKSKEEIEAIVKPKEEFRVLAKGIKVIGMEQK